MDRGAWQATVHGVAKSRTRLKQLSMHEESLWWSKRRKSSAPLCWHRENVRKGSGRTRVGEVAHFVASLPGYPSVAVGSFFLKLKRILKVLNTPVFKKEPQNFLRIKGSHHQVGLNLAAREEEVKFCHTADQRRAASGLSRSQRGF